MKKDAGTIAPSAYWDIPAKDFYSKEDEMPELFRRLLRKLIRLGPNAPTYATTKLQWEELDVDEAVKVDFFKLCQEFRDIFASSGNTGQLDTAQHSIDTKNAGNATKSQLYRLSPEKPAVVRDAISKMLEKGATEKFNSPWSSPIVLVEKSGEYRFCTDYHKLNAITKKERYPLRRIDDLLEKLKGAEYFSTFDLASGFWQISIYSPHKEKRSPSPTVDFSNTE